MEIYSVNCGSRYFGINEPDSDYDVWIINDSFEKPMNRMKGSREHSIHQIIWPLKEGLEQISGRVKNPCWIITLFPKEETDNPINQYLRQHGEEIITASRKYLYNLVMDYAQNYGWFGLRGCARYRQKAVMYRFLWLDIFAAYAELGSIKPAFKKVEANAEYYRKIRAGEFLVEELEQQHKEKINRLKLYQNFFDIDNIEYQNQIKQDIQNLLAKIQ